LTLFFGVRNLVGRVVIRRYFNLSNLLHRKKFFSLNGVENCISQRSCKPVSSFAFDLIVAYVVSETKYLTYLEVEFAADLA